jgi:hypothetical protein
MAAAPRGIVQVSVQTRAMPFDVQARLRVGARLQHLQSERGALVAKLQALSDPQDVEMYEQVQGQSRSCTAYLDTTTRR